VYHTVQIFRNLFREKETPEVQSGVKRWPGDEEKGHRERSVHRRQEQVVQFAFN
jgi:hypothetical protein